MNKIHITNLDLERLNFLLSKKQTLDEFDKTLKQELQKAVIVEPKEIPADVITMNSHVEFIDEETGKDLIYWLVFPEDSDFAARKISVLSPIGCALLGYKVGDVIELKTPAGKKHLKVKKILSQPEREGKFDL